MSDIAIGPFSFPMPLLLFFGAIIAAMAIGKGLARNNHADVMLSIWIVIGLALSAARMAFVWRYRDLYLLEPLRMLDVRDGGFSWKAGLAMAVAAATWIAWRHVYLRKTLMAALAAGGVVWGAGMLALATSVLSATLPDVTLASLEGDPVRLASMVGKPVVVNLWASWCPPCRREMPVFAKAQAQHTDVVFVFASQGEAAPAVKSYLARERLVLQNVLLDRIGTIARKVGARGLPTTLFFDAKGKLVDRRTGEVSAATLVERLNSLRNAAPAPSIDRATH